MEPGVLHVHARRTSDATNHQPAGFRSLGPSLAVGSCEVRLPSDAHSSDYYRLLRNGPQRSATPLLHPVRRRCSNSEHTTPAHPAHPAGRFSRQRPLRWPGGGASAAAAGRPGRPVPRLVPSSHGTSTKSAEVLSSDCMRSLWELASRVARQKSRLWLGLGERRHPPSCAKGSTPHAPHEGCRGRRLALFSGSAEVCY